MSDPTKVTGITVVEGKLFVKGRECWSADHILHVVGTTYRDQCIQFFKARQQLLDERDRGMGVEPIPVEWEKHDIQECMSMSSMALCELGLKFTFEFEDAEFRFTAE